MTRIPAFAPGLEHVVNHGPFYRSDELVAGVHRAVGETSTGFRPAHGLGRVYAGSFTVTPWQRRSRERPISSGRRAGMMTKTVAAVQATGWDTVWVLDGAWSRCRRSGTRARHADAGRPALPRLPARAPPRCGRAEPPRQSRTRARRAPMDGHRNPRGGVPVLDVRGARRS
jgi:hypothetical protein